MFKVLLREFGLFNKYPLLWGAIILISLIPSIYCFVYLSSFWDPYAHLDKLPVGLANFDKGIQYEGHRFDIGSEFAGSIQEQRLFAFKHHGTKQDAEDAVRSGKAYFSVVVPEDFSKKAVPGKAVGKFDLIASPGSSYTAMKIAEKFAENAAEKLNYELNKKRWEVELEALKKEKEGIEKLLAGMERIQQGLKEMEKGLDREAAGVWKVYDGQAEMTAGIGSIDTAMLVSKGKQLHGATAELACGLARSGLLGSIVGLPSSEEMNKLAEGARLYQLKIEELARGIEKALAGSKKLAEGEKKLVGGIEVLKEASQQLLKGSGKVTAGLNEFLESIPELDFNPEDLATSIKVNTVELNEATSNGEAFAPYFMGLSMWVGTMVISYVFRYTVFAESVGGAGFWSKIAGKDVMPLCIIFLSAIILALTIHVMIKVPLYSFFGYHLILLAAAFAYFCVIIGTVRLLGDTGKIIALLFLVLQIASAGGVYPVELSSMFYQRVSPYLPMTSVVEGLRAAMFGSFDGAWLPYLMRLVPWAVFGFLLSVISRKRFTVIADDEYELAIVLPGRK